MEARIILAPALSVFHSVTGMIAFNSYAKEDTVSINKKLFDDEQPIEELAVLNTVEHDTLANAVTEIDTDSDRNIQSV